MTDEDKKLVFEYMGWCQHKYAASGKLWGTGICIRCKDPLPREHTLDGNDMVAAMNKMVEKGDWKDFDSYSCRVFVNDNSIKFNLKKETWISWLMQPTRFFELMASWLKEKEHENSRT